MPVGPAPVTPANDASGGQPAVGNSRVIIVSEPDSYGGSINAGLAFPEFAPASFSVIGITATTTLAQNPPLVVRVDSSGGNRTVTLPATSSCNNHIWHISKIVAANTVTVAINASDAWYGDTALQTLSAQWDSVTLISVNDPANSIAGWHVIAST